MNFTLYKFVMLVMLSLCCLPDVGAQTITTSNTYNGRASDYYINMSFSGVDAGSFDCSADNDISVYAGTGYNTDEYVHNRQLSFPGGYASGGPNYWGVGSNVNFTFYVTIIKKGHDHRSGCLECSTAACSGGGVAYHYIGIGNKTQATHYIYAPTINTSYYDSVLLTGNIYLPRIYWSKGSDIPDGPNLKYRVYRDGALIGTVQSPTTSFVDSALLTGSHVYKVSSYTTAWGAPQESFSANRTITIGNKLLTATDATFYGKTRLSWQNIARYAPNDIQVMRNNEQIAVINKNSTTYNDFDGVPGVVYNYSISPIDSNNNTPFAFYDNGASRPNGVLSGYVRSVLGTGVQGVTLTATGTAGGQSHTYTATSDPTGFYKINDIFYDTLATYTVVPSKGSDQFNPGSVSRAIDVINYNNSLPDIYDTTVFTVSGRVTFANTTGCPVNGAKLFLNGTNQNISTDAAGNYSFIAQQPGWYDVAFQLGNHTFDSVSRHVFVTSNTSGVNFADTKTDTLLIDLKGGCNNQIVDSAHFEVISDPTGGGAGCFSKTYKSNGYDPVVLILPAQKYRVSVPGAYNPVNDLNITTSLVPIDLDLTLRDTVQLTSIDTAVRIRPAYNDTITLTNIIHHNADTTRTIDTVTRAITPYRAARFTFHGPLSISLTNVDSLLCVGYVVEQGNKIPMGIQIKENSTYHSNVTSCFQDTGTIRIFDDVSGIGLSYQHFDHGRLVYQLIPGEPNVPDLYTNPHHHQKLLNVFVSAGSQSKNLDAWMTILGDKTLTATYVSKTPPMPLMVLHDPPGSNSYSSYEKDSAFSMNVSNFLDTTQNNGGYLGIMVGKKFTVPVLGLSIPGAYFNTQINGADGTTGNNTQSTNISFTATQTIATSGDPRFVGRDADVFIGGTVNTKYAKAFTLSLPAGQCQVTQDTVLIWGLDSVTSQFVYTGEHIRNTLLTQLNDLITIAPDSMKSYFQNQINMWNQVLKNDSLAIANSYYDHNVSFSSGISYDYSQQQDSSFENSYTYSTTRDVNFSIGAGISDAELIDINAGYNMEFHGESGHSSTASGTNTTIFNYHLEDQVPGNFYSVNIGADKNYGSPVFKIFAGTSACPHEEGTQFRDLPTLTITPGSIFNVPASQPASFVAQIGNQSESGETRTYNVQLDATTNLDGATVKIGGQNITQTPASFTVPAYHTLQAALTVEKGPFADYYNDLGIIISSPCDNDISTTVPITVHFQSECSDIALAVPTDNWLVNASSNDTLIVAFSAYNASNPNLQEIGLQYRVKGSLQAWLNGPVVQKADLIAPYKTVLFNVTNLVDGNYEIRAYARCLTPNNVLSYTYSPTLSGVIDRTGFALNGTPQPANGILNKGDNISIQFNEAIDCNQLYGHINTSLRRADNGVVVPSTFTCTSTGLLITTNPAGLLDSFNNVVLIATVDNVFDANGNGLGSPVEWSFLVNRSDVYWNPSNMNITQTVGSAASGISTLINKASTTQSYTLQYVPTWLTPSVTSGSISSNGIDSIRFTVNAPLNPGTYIDTIIAISNGLQAKLFVKLDVVNPSPNWTVNPANYQYSMNITTNFSLTQLSAPLSTDVRDVVAVFKGDECRGVARITYDAFNHKYNAFVTAYSNRLVGDTFTFRMWDAMPGTEYQAKERLQFIDNATIGQPYAPYILHPEGVFQTIAMTTGWNWFSLNVRATDMSPAKMLSQLRADTSTQVKTDNAFAQYTVAGTSRGWMGSLSAFTTNKSYMMYLSHPDTLHVLGQPVTDTSRMQIAAGWNWIGYPRQTIMDAATYLSTANVAEGDLLKTQSTFTQYTNSHWSGTLNYMIPGQGYKLKTANSFNFVVPPSRSLPSWNQEQYLYQQNQSITAELQFNGTPAAQSHYLVGAFTGTTCIGVAQPLFIPELNVYRVFLTVHGDTANVNQAISFKVYDTDNDIEYTPTYDAISVSPDTTIARVQSPYIINVQTTTGVNSISFTEGYGLLQNVPNPFSKNTSIDYVIPTAQQVTITLYDEAGRLIAELVNGKQDAGVHQIAFGQDQLGSGVYFYQMKAGDFVKTRRMMIIK